MEGEGITAIDPPPPPPPSHSPEIAVVESAGDEDPAVDSPPSDDDETTLQAISPDESEEELRARILKQVEYYFSDENLPNDKFLLKQMKKDKAGFVSISLIGSFRKMKKLSKDVSLIAEALKESSQLVVSSDGKKVKRLHPLPSSETKDPKSCTVVVENLPEDRSIENIRKICCQVGSIKSITIHDPLAAEDAEQSNKADKPISGRMHALVEYETMEAAEKAVATLNDKTDWRNGLRVQLLRKKVGYGLGRNVARKGSDSEKGGHARVPVSVGDEKNNQSIEQHGEPGDEDGDHISKERNGRKGRNRSKGRKYHGNNGMGHGNGSVVEALKPPPGPRMPDGTRGFTMGRGRPLVSNSV